MRASDSRHQHPNTAESRAILDALPAIAWCKLPDGSNEFVNQRWQDYTGIPEDEARGQGWQAAVHPDDLPKLTEKCAEMVGGPKKCAFVKDELRFDAALDHRAADFPARLAAACPQGIDVYFENVGGAIWEAVLPLLNDFARVTVAGLIAQYNGVPPGDGTDRLPATMRQILSKRLTIRGFIYYNFAAEHYADFLREVGAGVAAGRIRYREDIVDGLENAPGAFIGMLEGRNFGKLIVRVAP